MLSKSIWLSLKPETRAVLVSTFELKKTLYVDVFDGRVMEDGYGNSLPEITVKKLQDALESKEEDFYKLFYLMVDKIEGRVKPEVSKEAPKGKIEEEIDYSKIDKRSKVYQDAKKAGLI